MGPTEQEIQEGISLNKFVSKEKKGDFTDKSGKEWFKKKGESMDDLKLRAEGKKKDDK